MKFDNYRHYLLAEFERRRLRNTSYSLRAYARDIGTSVSRLSEALNHRRGLSLQLAEKMINKLNLDGTDSEIFRLSVEAEHSRSPRSKAQAQEKLKNILAALTEQPLKTSTIVDWIAEAILKISQKEKVFERISEVARRLDVGDYRVIHSLRFLARLGYIKGPPNFKTYLENRGAGRRLNVDYAQILEQAHKFYALNEKNSQFEHRAVLLEEKDQGKAHLILRKAVAEIEKLEKISKKSKVVFVAHQIFSVEREK